MDLNQIEAERDRYRDALVWALDAFKTAGDNHGCDYCRADAATLRRVLEEGTNA